MGFGCECGYAWKGVAPETRHHEGDYYTLVELEEWEEEASGAIATFVEASASGRRDRWFEESKIFNEMYPRDLPDHEVIRDILAASIRSRGLGVYRCPECRRAYFQEQSGTNWWWKLQFVERIGTP